MGLLDQVMGAALGAASGRAGGAGTTSPIVQAVLMALAAQARGGGTARPGAGPAGGLGNLLGGLAGGGANAGLGGLLGGLGGASSLAALLEQFSRNGQGAAAASWVGTGPNAPIAPAGLADALGDGAIQELVQRTGLQPQALLQELSELLPGAVDRLTPQGRLPTDDELG